MSGWQRTVIPPLSLGIFTCSTSNRSFTCDARGRAVSHQALQLRDFHNAGRNRINQPSNAALIPQEGALIRRIALSILLEKDLAHYLNPPLPSFLFLTFIF